MESLDPIPHARILPRAFYRRDALRLARALLGKVLVHETPEGTSAGRIVEVEAYRGPEDRAAHTFGGRRTPRNEVMWGEAGHAYVYFVYGMHWCLNAVAAAPGLPEAVLIRALEPLAGLELVRARRLARRRSASARIPDTRLLSGPANVCQGLGLDGSLNGADLCAGPLTIRDAAPVPPRRVLRTPRIGVDYAGEHAARPWRFVIAESPSLSGRTAR